MDRCTISGDFTTRIGEAILAVPDGQRGEVIRAHEGAYRLVGGMNAGYIARDGLTLEGFGAVNALARALKVEPDKLPKATKPVKE